MTTKKTAFLGLGSNLNNPTQQLHTFINALSAEPNIRLLKISSFHTNPPLAGSPAQPDFINAVVQIETALEPLDLLKIILSLEEKQGRMRDVRWGPRTIDCDILLCGDLILTSEALTIPHYDLENRAFVVLPLCEIAPDLRLPNGVLIGELVKKFSSV